MSSLRVRLKELRTTKGIIQGDLGKIVGVKTSEISGYEIGTRNPSFDVLIRIADYFNVTTDYLIGRGEKEMNQTLEQRVSQLEKEIAELKVQVSERPEVDEMIKVIERASIPHNL